MLNLKECGDSKKGKKIDSATLMNKGLELIEACHLFAISEHFVTIVVFLSVISSTFLRQLK